MWNHSTYRKRDDEQRGLWTVLSLDALKAADPDIVPEDISAESIVDVDNDVLKNAALYSNTGEEMQCVIFKFENLFTKEHINSLKQSDITEFFKTVWIYL